MDGGETWTELTNGLPKSDMGKIGLAISPQKPDILYAAIELDRRTGGVYRSTNQGASWEKRSDAVSGATGPHYYQELYACPHHFDRLYLMDVRIQISHDGGKTFTRLNETDKHSDNHSINFHPTLPDYLLIGTDGGIYESYDGAKNWRFFDNLPITQYYKVAVDDAEPFYFIYGGTQDNGSHGGPSRTDNRHGIRNADWFKTLGADGHQSATEPGNPNIMYAETQQGGMHRIDRITGEQVNIQPQPAAGEPYERFNWDAPIIVSPHNPAHLYFASQRVWKSEDRGDSWTAISGDLTKNEERITLPIMGKQQSWDAAWDVLAMSNYNTITSLSESPKQAGLVYAGTDDGIVQVTEDGGANWKKIMVGSMPGVPATAFVNDIRADLHDANTVYIALDNHKYGDFKPYFLKSTDRGKTWKNISNNLPEKTLVWRCVQDHVDPNLLFLATEFGIYFSTNGGEEWIKFKGGVPTISFRDITIQRRENDLVAASFGRGFFVLDDISVLRNLSEEKLDEPAVLFKPRQTWWYAEKSIIGNPGAGHYAAKNPEYGAHFTYYLKEGLTTTASARKKAEKKLKKEGEDIPFPGWEVLEAEKREMKPQIWLVVKDGSGEIVNRIAGKSSAGMHRVAWNLRYASKSPVNARSGRSSYGNYGFLAMPGTYTVTLVEEEAGQLTTLAGPESFEVVPLRKGALEGSSPEQMMAYYDQLNQLRKDYSTAGETLKYCEDKSKAIRIAINRSAKEAGSLVEQWYAVQQKINALDLTINGNDAKSEIGEKQQPTIASRYFNARNGARTSYGPTATNKASLAIAQTELAKVLQSLKEISQQSIPNLEKALLEIGAPVIESPIMPKN